MSKVRFVDSSIRVNSGGGEGGGSSISASYALTSSYSNFSISSSYVATASYSNFATSASYAEYAVSASHEIVKEVSSSYADTASLAQSGNGPFTGSFTGSFIGNGTGLFSGSFSGSIPDAFQIISGSVSASISPDNGLKINSGVEISLISGSAFSVIEEDAEAAYKNRLDFTYDQQDPTLTITARSATSLLHLKTGGASTGTTYNSQGEITRNSAGVNYGITIGTGFNPSLGNQMTLGFYNRRWKNLYISTGDKISFGVNNSLNVDLVSLRHTAGTNELVISGSSDVTLDVKGNIISTGSLQVSGSVDIAIPSGSAFTITETDKDQKGRLDFTFDDGDPTLEIEGRSSVAKIVLSANDGESNNLKIQSDGQVYASDTSVYTGSIKFKPGGIEAITTGINSSPFIGSQTRPFYKYYMAQIGGQFISDGTYAKQQFFLNSTATGYQRIDGLYNQASGMRLVVSGSVVSGGDGYLRNPNNQYFQIQDDSTGTGNNASIPFRVGKSGSLAINLNQSKGFGFNQYYTASAMVHVEAEPNYDLNLFQGNDVLGNNVFEVDRDGNLTVDAEISASGDLYARDGRFSRDGGAAEIEIIASEIAGGIIGTQTSDNLLFRRFNIPKFTISESRNFSHQNLDVQGQVSASTYLGDGSQLTGITSPSGKFGISNSSGEFTYYTTLTLAIAAASSGDVVQMFANVEETGAVEVAVPDGVTIDGNGYTYTLNNAGTENALTYTSAASTTNYLTNIRIVRKGGTFSNTNSACILIGASNQKKNLYGDGVRLESDFGTCLTSTGAGSRFDEVTGIVGEGIQGAYWTYGRLKSCDFKGTTSFGIQVRNGSEAIECKGESTSNYGIYFLSGLQTSTSCIGISDSSRGIVTNVDIRDCTGESNSSFGITLSSTVTATNCTGRSNSGNGIYTDSTSEIIDCTGISVSGPGIYLRNNFSGTAHNCVAYSSTSTVGALRFESGGTITNSSIFHEGSSGGNQHAIYTSGTAKVTIIGCDITANDPSSNAVYAVSPGANTLLQNNVYEGMTTALSANVTQVAVSVADTYGNTHVTSSVPYNYDFTGATSISGSTLLLSGSLLNSGTVSIDDTDSPYTITGTQQFVLIDPSGGDVTINMPDAATYPGREIRFKLTQAAGANTVTLQRQGADTIDGATTYTDLDIQYESISTVSDGSTGWFIF